MSFSPDERRVRQCEATRRYRARGGEERRQRELAARRAYHATHRDDLNTKSLAYRHANLEDRRAKDNQWRRNNLGRRSAAQARYIAAKLNATLGPDPRIDALYEIAAWLRAHGDDVHVDHILPLRPSDSLSAVGLHVYANLQILPAIENLKKGNR